MRGYRDFKGFVLLFCVLLFPVSGFSVPVDAVDISDERYFQAVHKEISQAKDSIYMAMFEIYIYPDDVHSAPYRLVQDLIDAHKRGVRVKVFLDRSYGYDEDKNDLSFLILSKSGIDVRFIAPSKRLHDKLIVVDKEITISGSTNWSYSALKLNSENADLIRSKGYAKGKLKNILRLRPFSQAKIIDEAQTISVRCPNRFLKDKNLAPRMITRHDERAFDLYLLLLKDPSVDYKKIAEGLGIERQGKAGYRRQINKSLRKLSRDYGLVRVEFIFGGELKIGSIRGYGGEIRDNKEGGYFNIPLAYWEYGWSRRLSHKAKFAYLVNLYKQETSKIKPWWSLSLGLLAQDFHIDEWTIRKGMIELERYGVLTIRRGRISEDRGFEYREPNYYLLGQLYSQEEMEKKWKVMERDYGRDMVRKAREFGFMIDRANYLAVTKDFIRLIKEYGEGEVRVATKVVAGMRPDNPLRGVRYIEGILKRKAKENETRGVSIRADEGQ